MRGNPKGALLDGSLFTSRVGLPRRFAAVGETPQGQICAGYPAPDATLILANSGTVATRVAVGYSPDGLREGSRTLGLASAQLGYPL